MLAHVGYGSIMPQGRRTIDGTASDRCGDRAGYELVVPQKGPTAMRAPNSDASRSTQAGEQAQLQSGQATATRDSVNAAAQLQSVVFDPNVDDLVRLDIRDYFLSGTLNELMVTLRQIFSDNTEAARILVRVLHFLLHNQWVVDSTTNEVYRALRGSAVGLQHSGDLMDLCFWWKVERWSLCLRS